MIHRGTVLCDIINSIVTPFSGLPNGAIFMWGKKAALHHRPGLYRKLSCTKCVSVYGGWPAYTLWPTGREARVIRYL